MNNKFNLKKIRTTFGNRFVINKPETCDIVIICVNKGYGLIPVSICLPHQVYEKKINKLIKEYPNHSITIIPSRSNEYVELLK